MKTLLRPTLPVLILCPILASGLAPAATADGLDTSKVPAEARWVVHIDVESALRTARLSRELLARAAFDFVYDKQVFKIRIKELSFMQTLKKNRWLSVGLATFALSAILACGAWVALCGVMRSLLVSISKDVEPAAQSTVVQPPRTVVFPQ